MTASEQHSTEPGRPKGLVALFWLAYHQVAGVLGALGIVVYASHLISLDLRGIVALLFSFWAETVRPFVGLVLAYTYEPAARLFGFDIDIDIDAQTKDYLGAGVVLASSYARMWRAEGLMLKEPGLVNFLRFWVGLFGLMVLGWPFFAVAFPAYLAWTRIHDGRLAPGAIRRILLILTPLIWVAILLGVNALLALSGDPGT